MQNIPTSHFGVRMPEPVKNALQQAAGTVGAQGRNGKAGKKALEYIIKGLQAEGFLTNWPESKEGKNAN